MPNKTRDQYVAEGRCRDCGRFPLATKLRCRPCADKHSKRNRSYEDAARQAGKCVLCSSTAMPGRILCGDCRNRRGYAGTRPGWIYFIGESDDEQYVKIGFTSAQPEMRLKQLQIGNPRLLTLLAVIPVDDVYAHEGLFHGMLGEHRVQGEWFRRSAPINTFIQKFGDQRKLGD